MLTGGASARHNQGRTTASRPRTRRTRAYAVSNASGQATDSAAPFNDNPESHATNNRHNHEADTVCRGSTSAKKNENDPPHPPR